MKNRTKRIKKRPWKDDKAGLHQLLNVWYWRIKDIAEFYGCSTGTIINTAKKLGVYKPRFSMVHRLGISAGCSGIPKTQRHRKNISKNKKGWGFDGEHRTNLSIAGRGNTNPEGNSTPKKYIDEVVMYMRELRRQGMKLREIGDEFGTSPQSIYSLLKNRTEEDNNEG